jgi:hypothetical protein
LGEHLLHKPLILVGGVGPRLVPYHDCPAHDDLLFSVYRSLFQMADCRRITVNFAIR